MPRHATCYVPDDIRDPIEMLLERRTKAPPEHELALAVLSQALIDLRRGPREKVWRPIYEQTRAWVRSDERHAFSFVWLCELFDIDVEAARERVLGAEPMPLAPHQRPDVGLIRHAHRLRVSGQGAKGARLGPRRWGT